MPPHEASLRQISAADPGRSTWLSANAGSGKTSVLIDRVARLLLRGVDPAHVLCLTYTKSAASEMQNRLFKRLGEWAMLPDPDLHRSLTELGLEGRHSGDTLAGARRLFARAIETPGGLRIQTIHSFCAGLLRRFPLEAGVSPQFTEADERSARLLRQEIVEEMAAGIAPEAVLGLGRIHSGAEFDKLLAEIAALGDAKGLTEGAALALFGVPEGESLAAILADCFATGDADLLRAVAEAMPQGTKTDARQAPRVAEVAGLLPAARALDLLEGLVLYGSGKTPFAARIDDFPNKDLRLGLLAPLMPALNGLLRRVEAARARRIALEAAQRTATLYRFAAAFLPLYAARKAARGWLDFDDLIALTTRLLSSPGVAAWVLYRLDGGIEHILVDEAQDTSPAQWRVIEALAQEFTSGQSAHQGQRTLFVVGDKKQSIYSFQGANVAIFDRKRDRFRAAFDAARMAFATTSLDTSFRSSPAILDLVDALFQEPELAGAMGDGVAHQAFRVDLPGRVELWPAVPPEKDDDPDDWENPVDRVSPRHHTAILARQVAGRIRQMLDEGAQIVSREGPRRVHAGDFLILVQRRSALFAELIRACKEARLPIAGADRLKLAGEMAVKDLTSLLAFLATPEDDLALAEALRSPLIGLGEGDLYDLAQGRPTRYLWEALRARAGRFGAVLEVLTDLRDRADFLRPYDLLTRILIQHDGRRRLLTRLGDEAEEGIDAFLQQALDYETAEVPSLTGFLVWLQSDEMEIKRQVDAAGGKIRIMTVHGAKGLESEIVILPDCADRANPDRANVLPDEDGLPMWAMPAHARPPALEARAAARRDHRHEESLRLLYVALTRARSVLIVAAAGETKASVKDGGKEVPKPLIDLCWYRLVERALCRLSPVDQGPSGRVHLYGQFPPALGAPAPAPVAPAGDLPDLPDWAGRSHPAPDHPAPPLSPSDLGGAKVLPGEPDEEAGSAEGEAARRRGTAIHRLLEHLPGAAPEDWPALAAALLPEDDLRAAALAEAARVVRDPALAPLFAPGALSEVPITGAIGGRRVLGTIDRLIVGPDEVTLIDFKSNRQVPASAGEVPEGLLRQMGAYVHLLAQVYPGRRLRAAILWTASASLMPLDPEIVRQALDRATIS
ncbi:MAG: double-strand break repair helicase AddA [Paracoccaceae bacterium]